MDPLLQHQELRHQDLLTPSEEFTAAAHPHGNSAALLASHKEELVLLHDTHNCIMGDELVAQAMRNRVAAARRHQVV